MPTEESKTDLEIDLSDYTEIECAMCHCTMMIHDGMDPSKYCDQCAHKIAEDDFPKMLQRAEKSESVLTRIMKFCENQHKSTIWEHGAIKTQPCMCLGCCMKREILEIPFHVQQSS